MKTIQKLFIGLIVAFAFLTGTLRLQSQQELPDTVWTKDLWPLEIVRAIFTPDGSKIIVLAKDQIILFDVVTGNELKKIDFYQYSLGSQAWDMEFSPDSNQIAIASANGRIVIMSLPNYDTLKTFFIHKSINDISYNSSGDKLFIITGTQEYRNQKNILIYDINSEHLIDEIGDDGATFKIALSYSNPFFATYSFKVIGEHPEHQTHTIKLWDANSLTEIATLGTHDEYVWDLDFSPDGKYIASSDQNGNVNIWDVNKRILFKNINFGKYQDIWKICFTPDSKYIIMSDPSGGEYKTHIWDFINDKPVYTYHVCPSNDLDISNDGKQIIIAGVRNIYLLNTKAIGTYVSELTTNDFIIYPNPNNGIANITINLDTAQKIKIVIIDNIGKIIKEFKNGILEAGIQNLRWDTINVSSGIYYCKITGSNINKTIKIIVNK